MQLQAFALIGVCLASILAVAGCGAPQPVADQADQVRQAPATQPAKRGGIFHVPVSGNIANLNPYNLSGSLNNFTQAIYEPLIVRDTEPGKNWYEDQKMAPGLAERWERPERHTYVFYLRKNATWHDGRPFTAADVVHTIGHLKENRGKVSDSSYAVNIAAAEALDSYAVRLTLNLPNPEFLNELYQIEIIAKHVAESGKQLENTAIGTGPFTLREFETSTGFKVARNPNYWLKDPASASGQSMPYIDGIVGHSLADRGTVIAAFAADNLDMMNAEDKVQFSTIQGLRPGLTFERFYGQYSFGGFFAMDAPPFNDVRVRRAINLAADRQAMIQNATFGEGIINPPGTYGWKKGYAIPQDELLKLPGYNPETKQQDIAQAKRLLLDAGYPNGFAAKVSYGSASTNPKPIAEVLASQMQQIGVNLTLAPLDRASYAAATRDQSYEMVILGSSSRDSRGDLYEQFHSRGTFNKKGPKDPELDAILEKYMAEENQAEAQKLSQQFQRRLYDQAYFIGAFERASYTIYQPWVHDVLNNYGANPIPYWWPPRAWMDLDAMPAARRSEKLP